MLNWKPILFLAAFATCFALGCGDKDDDSGAVRTETHELR